MGARSQSFHPGLRGDAAPTARGKAVRILAIPRGGCHGLPSRHHPVRVTHLMRPRASAMPLGRRMVHSFVGRFRCDTNASPFGAGLSTESLEGGIERGEEVVWAERTDQLVALELGTDGTL